MSIETFLLIAVAYGAATLAAGLIGIAIILYRAKKRNERKPWRVR